MFLGELVAHILQITMVKLSMDNAVKHGAYSLGFVCVDILLMLAKDL